MGHKLPQTTRDAIWWMLAGVETSAVIRMYAGVSLMTIRKLKAEFYGHPLIPGPPRRKRIPQDTRDEVKRLLWDGHDRKKIAETTDVSLDTVRALEQEIR